MPTTRRHLLSFAALAATLPRPGLAGPYPARPVRILVGFPPGGGADILARLAAEWLQVRLGQPFLVENRPGAGTNLATEAVIRATADGHTLLKTTTSNLLNGALYPELGYDFMRDIAPVAGLSIQPLVLVVAPNLPVDSVAALIEHAKVRPGAVALANTGTGTISHLAGEAFRRQAGLDLVAVPYRGGAAIAPDLLGGRVQAAFDNMPGWIEHIRAGRVRALAVTTAAPSAAMPEVPALAATLQGYEAFTLAGIGAPRGTPAEIVGLLNAAINAGFADPAMQARLAALGATPLPGSAADFAALIARETARWTSVIRTLSLRVE